MACRTAGAADGNRLAYLDAYCDPYYVGLEFPRLTTPQWVGEPGVDAVVVLAIDDMRETQKYETYLRPILERLKKIDGRAAVSIMTCRAQPRHPQLTKWLAEGVSIECHTFDHPCPCLKDGDFDKAKGTYDRCVDLLNQIPGNRPVAHRQPCCDSQNTPSPRFWVEVINRTSPGGNFLAIDTSVFNITTAADKALPRELVADGDRKRFRKYLPFPSFVNTIENYPFPYVIGRLVWQFPCVVPSDWQAQNLQRPNNPQTVRDMQLALDATVMKQGVYALVFHPHGWIRNEQIVELVDHAVARHGKKVKFLNFAEAHQRLNKHMLAGQPLRIPHGQPHAGGDNGVRLLDLNRDGFLDVVIGNEQLQQTRLWSPQAEAWIESEFPVRIASGGKDLGVRFGIVRQNGLASLVVSNEQDQGGWHFDGAKWVADTALAQFEASGKRGRFTAGGSEIFTSRQGRDQGVRLHDVDAEGRCELLVSNSRQNLVFAWQADRGWQQLSFGLPPEAILVDDEGRDAGLRLVDINGDGRDDVLASDQDRFSLHLFADVKTGWSTKVTAARRPPQPQRDPTAGTQPDTIPPIVSHGTNNGAWFHSQHLWVQNEHTARLPNLVDRRSYAQLLAMQQTASAASREQTSPGNSDSGRWPPAEIDVKRTGGIPPLAPTEARKTIAVKPGLAVELVAAEPLVADPVAFDWGPDGRLWVAQMHDYPLGADGQGQPGGQIRVLTDSDGDGRYDKADVFLDGVAFPTGVKVWRKGVLVSAAPEIFYAEDTNGDGKADVRRTLYEGFGEGNQQHRTNGLRYGLDNWLYLANGDSGGTIVSRATKAQVNISGRDLRIRPDSGLLEATSGRAQFGVARDDWGNWFGSNNSNPMWHYVLADHYLRRNPHFAAGDVRHQVSVQPGASRVYPTSKTLARFNNPGSVNRFTSAASAMVYRDRYLGADYYGNSFVCEPVHNLVHREVIESDGVTFSSHRANDETESEFLTSTDNWFRPVMVRTGPDGALWIADMYRFVIEHPEWIPARTQQSLDLRAGHTLGRIYRVIRQGDRPELPRLDKRDAAGLVATLASPNGTLRDLAQQMMLWQKDPNVVPLVEKMARIDPSALARLHALSTLDGMGALDEKRADGGELIERALGDSHAGVRRHAVRLAEPRFKEHPELLAAAAKLVDDPDLHVRMQLAYSLGASNDPRAAAALAKLIVRDAPGDRYLRAACFSSLHAANAAQVASAALSTKPRTKAVEALLAELLPLVTRMGGNEVVEEILLTLVPPDSGGVRGLSAWQLEVLADVVHHVQHQQKQPQQAVAQRLETLVVQARNVVADPRNAEAERTAAMALLGRIAKHRAGEIAVLGALLTAANSPALQEASVEALARSGEASVPGRLLDGWRNHTPSRRAQILDVLFAREAWLSVLLERLQSGQFRPNDIDARRAQQLVNHRNKSIAQRANKLLATATSSRQAVLERYATALETTGDVSRGKAVFEKRCAACHKLDGIGHAVGPDLMALANKSPPALLVAILDPNRAVEDKFVDYQAVTDEGKTISGMLAAETGTSITLVGQENKRQTILRSQLELLQSSGKSLMPEGVEKDVSPADVADVLAYLVSTGPPAKQFAGNRPEIVKPSADGTLTLTAVNCRIYGEKLVFEDRHKNLGFWGSESDRAVWTLQLAAAGTYRVVADYACHNQHAENGWLLEYPRGQLSGRVAGTGTWSTYQQAELGRIELPPGRATLTFRAARGLRGFLIDLRGLRLVPVGK